MRIQNNFIYSNTMLKSSQKSVTQPDNQSTTDHSVKIQKAPLLSNAPVYFGSRADKIQDLVAAVGFARKYGVKTGLPENETKLRALLDGKTNPGKKGKHGKVYTSSEIYAKAVKLKNEAEAAKAEKAVKAIEDAEAAKKLKKAK
ncbi:MAG: hypothetical protein PHC34_06775 [Candidatus Gastranaerophilales bacterium]|nr:hypothetical protein [Candidatus Gastranaerophilales bacterium]